MIELLFILVACAIAYRIAFPASKVPAFVPQTVAATAPVVPVTPPADTSCIVSVRKKLAADEKLTPELKAAFDLIQAALEAK